MLGERASERERKTSLIAYLSVLSMFTAVLTHKRVVNVTRVSVCVHVFVLEGVVYVCLFIYLSKCLCVHVCVCAHSGPHTFYLCVLYPHPPSPPPISDANPYVVMTSRNRRRGR